MKNNIKKVKLTAVILAGGKGSRLGKLTKNIPKPLIEICGKPIIQYAIAWARYLGASKIVVSGSYMFDVLRESVRSFDKSVILVKDKIYMPGNRILGLFAAINEIEGDVAVFDGDYIYHKSVADTIKNNKYNNITVHASNERSEYTAQDVIVKFDDNNNLIDIFKTKSTKPLYKREYYFNSFLYCPALQLKSFFESAKKNFESSDKKNKHIEDAVLAYRKEGNIVKVINTGPPLWIEIDNEEELKVAEKFIKRYKNDII